ncbi:MAG: electron transfer flavoprotein subunit beta [Candidatus Marinimicrobia bacterium]|mgnify:FL=1|nr:electron transfer flavoprotein subunit beta [Candidatus Neomarinimicrobiota bacterium]|tara:strand:- start:381 stop:1163 length:783 start_codon:yes stop_codon:yes gene_type:complete
MKIVVLMKQVPNEDAAIKVDSSNKSIIEDNVTFITNEPDTYGLEEALLMKDKIESIDEVVVCSMGSSSCQQTIKDALAKGADRGIFINNPDQSNQDPLSRAKIIAKVLEKENFDIVLSGLQSDDDGYAQLGILLAELLKMNHASLVMGAEFIDNDTVKVKRELESGWFQWSELKLPISLTIQSGLNQPRYASLKGIMGVKKKTIDTFEIPDLGIGDVNSKTELVKLFAPVKTKTTEYIDGSTDEVVEKLVSIMKNEIKVI